MKHYELDPKALLGGVIASDGNQEIVQLSLQKNNEIPAYEADAIILLLVLNGKAEIKNGGRSFCRLKACKLSVLSRWRRTAFARWLITPIFWLSNN